MNKIYIIIVSIVAFGAVYYILPKDVTAPHIEPINQVKENTNATSSTPAKSTSTPITSTTIPKNSTPAPIKQTKKIMNKITITTNKGNITFETYDADAPLAVENFVSLAKKGFYNGTIFHRVISGFMIQGGDPTGTGRGGPGYSFNDELNASTDSYKKGYTRGTVAMANSGPNTNGSQFFIMHKDYPLGHNYTIFGHVTGGMEVVDAIAAVETSPTDNRPLEKITMKTVSVQEVVVK